MGQFTQESFSFDLVWTVQGRLYADPRTVYDRSEALSEHIQAAKFRWVTEEMEGPHVTSLKARWKDGNVQVIASGVHYDPKALRASESDDSPLEGSRHRTEGSSRQTRF